MKIKPAEISRFRHILSDANPGDSIEFETAPHQKHKRGSIFLVLRVPSQYIVESERSPSGVYRVMVANLETGYCSLVVNSRSIRFVDAEVVTK